LGGGLFLGGGGGSLGCVGGGLGWVVFGRPGGVALWVRLVVGGGGGGWLGGGGGGGSFGAGFWGGGWVWGRVGVFLGVFVLHPPLLSIIDFSRANLVVSFR